MPRLLDAALNGVKHVRRDDGRKHALDDLRRPFYPAFDALTVLDDGRGRGIAPTQGTDINRILQQSPDT